MKRIGPILIACLYALPAAHGAEPESSLGRLFLTPEKRQALDRQRDFNQPETGDEPDGETLQLDGVVQRSSGRNSVWINRRLQTDADKAVRLEKSRPGAAELKLDNAEGARLKVGESINRKTHERKDVVAPGAVGAGRR
ncbi:MAG: hypothetical protein KGL40_11030 [Rhodocyclaceae bacterium]|nr:hypothetical protein [Rhodocyclaceae bacterium]